jgi:Transposase DDE domain
MDDTAFSAAVLSKLPLADASWRLLQFCMDDPWLQAVWDASRGRCYDRELPFPLLCHLVSEALLQHGGSGRQAFERAQEEGVLPVAISSVFEKLANVPLSVSESYLSQGTERLQAVLPGDSFVHPQAACWAGIELFAIDGKAIKHVKRLLKPLRGLQAGILGARAAVALNLRTGQAVAMAGHLDGEAGEAALAEKLLPKIGAARGTKPWVTILDRLYCNLIFPHRILAAGGHFIIRYDAHTSFIPDPDRPAQESRDAQGQTIVQRWGWLGKAKDRRRLYVREVTRVLPDGREICIVTDLLDEGTFPAEDLLAMYRQRWGIERVFHQITEVFSLKNLIGTSPKAVLFQLAFCLLLYNTLQVVRAHIAAGQKIEAETISNEKLFYDLKRQLVSLNELVEVPTLLEMLGTMPTISELKEYLKQRLQNVWSKRWKKAPSSRGGGHQKVEKTRVLGNHTSTYRVLEELNNGQTPSPISDPRP